VQAIGFIDLREGSAINFGFTEEQDFLRQEVRKFLDGNCPMEEVRELAKSEDGFSRDLWKQVTELGWLGLSIPEAHGGAGLSWVDLVVVLEETGRSLFPSPLLSTTLAAAVIREVGSDSQQARWLPGIAEGSQIGTVALLEESDSFEPEAIGLRGERDGSGWVLSGEKLFVPDAAAATLLVVPFRSGPARSEVSLAVVDRDASGVAVEDLPSIDLTKRMGRVTLSGVRIAPDALLGAPGTGWPAISRLIDRGACAVAAEMVGSAEAALDMMVDYAKQRIQFGSPIGRYQGVKHPLAEMYSDIESFKSLVYYAAWAIDENPEEATVAASRAKAYATEAFSRIGLDVVQLQGAIGYTWEYNAQLYLKRAKWARPAFGDADFHYARAAAMGGY
jgi:alkylation response protein AidB-like acyl-CoA dehydrogenase